MPPVRLVPHRTSGEFVEGQAPVNGRWGMKPWIRLDVDFHDDDWLYDEDERVCYAFECFLRYVRGHSTCGGRVKIRPIRFFVDRFRFRSGEEFWDRMFAIAKANDVIRERDGEWIVKNWDGYQEPSTDRVREFRARKKGLETNETNETDVTGETHITEQHITIQKENSPKGSLTASPDPLKSEPIPSELNSPPFRQAWERWVKHRSEIRKKLTPTTARSQLAYLAKDPATAIAKIEQSILKGWTGLFDLKDEKPKVQEREFKTVVSCRA